MLLIQYSYIQFTSHHNCDCRIKVSTKVQSREIWSCGASLRTKRTRAKLNRHITNHTRFTRTQKSVRFEYLTSSYAAWPHFLFSVYVRMRIVRVFYNMLAFLVRFTAFDQVSCFRCFCVCFCFWSVGQRNILNTIEWNVHFGWWFRARKRQGKRERERKKDENR